MLRNLCLTTCILASSLLLCSSFTSYSFHNNLAASRKYGRIVPTCRYSNEDSNKVQQSFQNSLNSSSSSSSERLSIPKFAYIVPLSIALFGAFEAANSDITTWIVPSQVLSITSYWRYFLAGAVSASFSHAVTVPFDVVKTRIQTTSEKSTIMKTLVDIFQTEGWATLFTGLLPTMVGYFTQGSLKYGFYEIFKPIIKTSLLGAGFALDNVYIFMIAGALAELIGSSTLSPFEAARIRLVSDSKYAENTFACVGKMITEEGWISLFLGLPALLLKNVPYSMVQLSSFEFFTTTVYTKLNEAGWTSAQAGELQFFITASCAFTAALLSTLASQPGDSLLSTINKSTRLAAQVDGNVNEVMRVSPVTRIQNAFKELGWGGLYKGTKARMVHVILIVVIQLLAYDYIKHLCGIPVTGSH